MTNFYIDIYFSGKHFIPNSSSGKQGKLKIIASLDSRETLETELFEFTDDEPQFNTELAWTMSRLTFQSLRSQKAVLKLQVFEESGSLSLSSSTLVGFLILDLREAVPMPMKNKDESYLSEASWKKLVNSTLPPGRPPPSIRAALIIEPSEPPKGNFVQNFKVEQRK